MKEAEAQYSISAHFLFIKHRDRKRTRAQINDMQWVYTDTGDAVIFIALIITLTFSVQDTPSSLLTASNCIIFWDWNKG